MIAPSALFLHFQLPGVRIHGSIPLRCNKMISEKEELLEWRKRAAAQPAGRVVLDLEADSLHRYQEKICLIQYADETGSCLIDPLSIEDMGPFYNWLKET